MSSQLLLFILLISFFNGHFVLLPGSNRFSSPEKRLKILSKKLVNFFSHVLYDKNTGMAALLKVEELITNESFINYCFNSNEPDTAYWQLYIIDHPFESDSINEAKDFVLALRVMLHEKERDKEIRMQSTGIYSRLLKTVAAVAAVILVAASTLAIMRISTRDQKAALSKAYSKARITATGKIFTSLKGQKKIILLPDNTIVKLNAGSELRVSKDFGQIERRVFLIGEALFEVVHKEEMPFMVQTEKYEVRDLGTVFNVKAYSNEKFSETSLISGSVEIKMANSSHKIKLSPYQKIIITDNKVMTSMSRQQQPVEDIEVVPVSFSNNRKDSAVVETAWSQDRLEIVNQRFADMKAELERWYNINIVFTDDSIMEYRFTATFEKETIQEALKALQYSYHFTYSIKDSTVTISK